MRDRAYFLLLYFAQGLHGDAEPLLKRSLTIYEKTLGTADPGVVAPFLNNLAELLGSKAFMLMPYRLWTG
jgi:hypothetical protein